MLLTLLLLVLIVIFLLRMGIVQRLRLLLGRPQGRARLPKSRPLSSPKPLTGRLADSGAYARDLWRSRGRRGQAVLLAIVALLLLLVLQLVPAGGSVAQRGHLAVAVAPFTTRGQPDSGTGAAVARDLVRGLIEDERYWVRQPIGLSLLAEPVTSVEEAARQADAGGYDVVIWGEVEPGAIADSSSLSARLLFTPRHDLPIASWPTAAERLALPAVYELSTSPINGLAVLGPLLDALDLYQQGNEIDRTVQLLTDLLERYEGVVSPKLPATLLGTLRWAQSDFAAAEALFHRALEVARDDPLLWNNLGVVLQDRGDLVGAEAAFKQSLELARRFEVDLAAVHYNRGLLYLDQPDRSLALNELRRAVELLPDRPAPLLELARVQRSMGELDAAAASVKRAEELAPEDPLVLLEAARLEFSRMVGDGAHIEWGLEMVERLPLERLTALRGRFDQVVEWLEGRVIVEQQAAARNDVRRRPEAGRLHEALARRLEAQLNEARYWQALAMIEEGHELSFEDRSLLGSLWDSLRGIVSPLELAQQNLAVLAQRTVSYRSLYQTGRALRLLGQSSGAAEQFNQAVEHDPGRPEGHYGLATLIWDERAGAAGEERLHELLHQAIAADEHFYPARHMLVQLELRGAHWEAALAHLDWLVQHRRQQTDLAVTRGVVLGKLQRYAEAETQLLPLANSGNLAAMVELALIYRATNHDDAAEDVLRRAVKQDKGATRAAYELGRLLQEHGREQAAANVLEEAVRANPGAMEAHLLLGQLYAGSLNRPERAIEHYQKAIEAGGSDPRNYETLGELFLKAHAPREAATALERSIELDPNSSEAHHKLATAYLALGQYREARQAEETALEKAPEGRYPEALVGIGDSYRLEGDFERAVEYYSRAIEQKPELIEAYIGLGRTAAAQGQWQIAIGHYQQALQLQPDSDQAHYWLATALLESGNHGSALSQFQRALEQNAEFVEAYYGAGRALASLGRRDQALERFGEALRRRPNYADALIARGRLFEQAGLLDQALADFQAAAAASPERAEPLYLQGLIYMGRNDFEGAVEALEQAVARQEAFAEAHYWLGRAYRAQSRNDEAYLRFRRAIELQPDYTEARYYLGLAEEERGNRVEAIAAYELVVAQAPPDSPWRANAQQALDRLR